MLEGVQLGSAEREGLGPEDTLTPRNVVGWQRDVPAILAPAPKDAAAEAAYRQAAASDAKRRYAAALQKQIEEKSAQRRRDGSELTGNPQWQNGVDGMIPPAALHALAMEQAQPVIEADPSAPPARKPRAEPAPADEAQRRAHADALKAQAEEQRLQKKSGEVASKPYYRPRPPQDPMMMLNSSNVNNGDRSVAQRGDLQEHSVPQQQPWDPFFRAVPAADDRRRYGEELQRQALEEKARKRDGVLAAKPGHGAEDMGSAISAAPPAPCAVGTPENPQSGTEGASRRGAPQSRGSKGSEDCHPLTTAAAAVLGMPPQQNPVRLIAPYLGQPEEDEGSQVAAKRAYAKDLLLQAEADRARRRGQQLTDKPQWATPSTRQAKLALAS